MNERLIVEALNAKYMPENGSRACDITPIQIKAANIVGRLLLHASKRGRRKKGKWV